MLFVSPLLRNGGYYLSKISYQQIVDEGEVNLFNQVITELQAEIYETENFYFITLLNSKL